MNSFLKSVIIIIIILIILALGKVPYFQQIGRDLYAKLEAWVRGLWKSGVDFWNQHILGRVSSEIDKRQEIVKKQIGNQAKQVEQTLWQKIKDYFLGLTGQQQPANK